MALDIVNTQGTLLYIVPEGTDLTDISKIETAIAAGEQVNCIQNLGNVGTTREVQEYSCLSSDEIAKSLGSVKAGSLNIDLLFHAENGTSDGLSELRTMYSTNTRREFIIQLTDAGTVSPTYITFQAAVSALDVVIDKDSAVMANFTAEITSLPIFTDATDV